jgi:Mor family transcriptional regulator
MQSLLLERRYFAWGETSNFIAISISNILALHLILNKIKIRERANVKYTNANNILPKKLIMEIQKYVQGETLYIPKQETAYKKWGTCSGGRKMLDRRNNAIKAAFTDGSTIQTLAQEYHLSAETIKKIVYSNKDTD